MPGATEGQSRADTVAPSRGLLRAELLLVQPADAAADPTVAGPQALVRAAAEWYRTVSYGRLDFRMETLKRWLSLPARSEVYASDPARYLRDAVAAADPYVDFSQVDVVYLAPSSSTAVATPTAAILNNLGVEADGKPVGLWVPWPPGFATDAAENPQGLLHETGHLLGLPDLYVAGVGASFNRWDLMAPRWPTELLAWHRWKLGWLDENQIVCITGRRRRLVTLTPLERPGGRKAVFVKRGDRILALEVRARLAYDSTLCATGVLVYELDQTPFKRSPVHLFTAGSDSRPPTTNCGPRWNAPFGLARGLPRELRLSTWGFRLRVLAKLADGSYRVRVTMR